MSHAADLPHVVIVGCGFAGLAATTGPERCSAAPLAAVGSGDLS